MQFHYQRLAQQIAHKIYQQQLLPQQKLNSLRDFAFQHQISISTAQRCYELLEAQGLIEVKAKSGYFVKAVPLSSRLPTSPDFESRPRVVTNLLLQNQIQEASIQPHLIPFGAIQLSPELIPVEPLRRSIQRALKHCKPEDFLYCNRQGHLHLREALAAHWREDGMYIAPEDIFVTNGCMPALALLIQQLSLQGESILIPTPTFNGQLQLIAGLKRRIIETPADARGIDLIRLEQAMIEHRPKLCLLTANFQNPLGYCLSDADKQKIAQLAAQYHCIILEDDIYAECSYRGQRPLPIKYWDEKGYVVWVGSVSKSLSTAYRLGWFCIGAQLKSIYPELFSANVSVNTPLQLGLADFIYSREYRNHLNRLHPQLMQQVEQYRRFILKAFAPLNIGLSQPQGGYALWLELPQVVDSLALYLAAQKNQINIVPGAVFGEDGRYQHFVRLNAGHGLTPQLQEAIQFLANWVKQYLATTEFA
ncbi:PLP-dependent aminotransferase family protein [Acinetobacter sp. S40]|uniref:aminotransferase-like domain-containing protein n=1 Tax=Acinetobacter sp. S40 TaxID=2767434 RepID=UPI001909C9DA|nr:PLP-dependent aminotransferase family protein [Acinetobacter sp. S40]MBJ9983854.1 PLP-dependent aminotransferase family protein [Acinetobacter sp. S40]